MTSRLWNITAVDCVQWQQQVYRLVAVRTYTKWIECNNLPKCYIGVLTSTSEAHIGPILSASVSRAGPDVCRRRWIYDIDRCASMMTTKTSTLYRRLLSLTVVAAVELALCAVSRLFDRRLAISIVTICCAVCCNQ